MKKIGVLFGKERSFPEAFIERVNSKNIKGITAEAVQIDDTVSLIDELVLKGYDRKIDIKYLELADGKHDVATWAKAFPEFLKWGWGSFVKSNPARR